MGARTTEPTAEKFMMWSLLKEMSKLNVRGLISQNRCLFFLQQNTCMRKQITRDQNDSLVMQRREFAETALRFQVCPMECLIWEMQPVKFK